MAIGWDDYFISIIHQIGFEKRQLDNVVHISLSLTLVSVGLSLNLSLQANYATAFIISGLSFAVILALFFRAVRAYNNYYLYLMLKNEIVEHDIIPIAQNIRDTIERVDLRRSWEGNNIKDLTNAQLTWRILIRTEFLFSLVGLILLEFFCLLKSGLMLTMWSGYVVIIQLFVIVLVVVGIAPKRSGILRGAKR